MNREQLRELLETLQEYGVMEYEVHGLKLRLRPVLPVAEDEPVEPREPPRTKYHSPFLFPGGAPPKFPGSDE